MKIDQKLSQIAQDAYNQVHSMDEALEAYEAAKASEQPVGSSCPECGESRYYNNGMCLACREECNVCGSGSYLPSGVCDHCNSRRKAMPDELSPEEPTLCHCGYAYHHQDFGGHWDIGCTNLNHPIRFRGYNEHDTKQMWEAYQLGYAERSAEAPKRESGKQE